MRRLGIALSSALPLALLATLVAAPPGQAAPVQAAPARAGSEPPKRATAHGSGGAVTSVDPYATRVGLQVLREGGNATDAAVATAAALGVTEPFSAGIGGGGYFVHYSAKTGKVQTIDGRETAPAKMPHDAFIDPVTAEPYNFSPELVTSGVSVGVPGTLATWQRALDRWGTRSLASSLRPAADLAEDGFTVDPTFRGQVVQNEERFKAFVPTRKLYWRGGHAPRVGSTFRNPDLAATYRLLARKGPDAFYRGVLSGEIVRAVRKPPKTKGTTLPVPKGFMVRRDLARYRALDRKPTKIGYRGLDVYGMAGSSSGGSTVGEALNILERSKLGRLPRAQALHRYLEASALAFADRGKYVGDPAQVKVPLKRLLSDKYAAERACQIAPRSTLAKPLEAGDVTSYDGKCGTGSTSATRTDDTENTQTTNLTVSDKWGNVVEYTLTIEQTGGSGIVVPGRGFLLNNELTDFSAVYDPADPNRIEPLKRPRSSMSPTIVLKKGEPMLAVGSPGGSTIITTVLQVLVDRLDLGMTLPQAIAAPRATQRNTATDQAEPAFVRRYGAALKALGHDVETYEDIFTGTHEIGAATGIEFGPGNRLTAVAEPKRRGGGAAAVVRPRN
ncbi:gamma-glutamyltransferase [Nocardioides sp. Root1257]|uniref:gamma-glutamyltransferase n=1 Tax=unclassified Nocardioides TaxID=2615069 RepID=UPI0006F41317|nr:MULTISPECIES: gamma-glutamyltransferase [unclassified Nocardioides]KQW49010.1 gamma-glutamyltransferase [Nocardioides sp. Root1257]KRC48184.1 gamma-glutamyltransferase [Nocardioides sp. Root224]